MAKNNKVMTQEEKSLLLKDLSARLPYLTSCYCKWTKDAPNGTSGCIQEVSTFLLEELMIIGDRNYECQICEIKPYLRPLSSITEEEKKELKKLFDADEITQDSICFIEGGTLEEYLSQIGYSFCWELTDWLNSHHFDYRGLIEKGLAIEAYEDMYK